MRRLVVCNAGFVKDHLGHPFTHTSTQKLVFYSRHRPTTTCRSPESAIADLAKLKVGQQYRIQVATLHINLSRHAWTQILRPRLLSVSLG